MSTESKDFDHYAIVLADLRARRLQIDQAIAAIEAIRGGGAPSAPNAPALPDQDDFEGPGDFLGMSISEAAKKLLKSRRKKMTNSEILAALQAGGLVMTSADPLNTVGAVITRRSKEVGDIVKIGRGVWGLKEWYPGRSFNKPTKGNRDLEAKVSSSEPAQPLSPDGDDPVL
ncbi:winged helix-turn-helix domain-containing protein [Aestuariivirga sp.]|uniref:winged helix-turn-helix domain-containing protein n=1 Tax=Aestuariivirga sp. TaxID=2650926 RepID=UPI0025B88D63|nr:winged helix-turn-helix domain-containing protein [Aestuariivirga sp.]MCA3555740.1 winged helix-turn-helix domain-containing protein [Aestuariivirga sp.]